MTDDTEPTAPTDEQHEDTLPTSVREGLRDATVPFDRTAPVAGHDSADHDPATEDTAAADLAPVGARLAAADVVGLGESTHGTREFFELKHRLVRHLVVEHGVRAVALESNLPETMALHDYVVHGEGDPRGALASVQVGCWNVESVFSMVEWLRAFNADRPLDDRVAVYGFAGHSTHGAVERLRDHFDAVDPDLLEDIADDLTVLDDEGESLTEDSPTAVEDVSGWVARAKRVVGTLRDHLDEHRAAHVGATSEEAWARARRYVAVIDQVSNRTLALDAFERGARAEYDRTEYLRRLRREGLPGRAMADNAAWIRDYTDADTLVLWAHDAHLNRVSFAFPGVEGSTRNLGSCLADRHGEDYYAVGFSFARGTFRAVRENADGVFEPGAVCLDRPVPGTLDAALDALDEPTAFADLRAAREDERTSDWLRQPRTGFRTGGTYHPADPAEHLAEYVYADAFDAICFVGETTRARSIDSTDALDSADGTESGQNEGRPDGETTHDTSETT